MKEKMWRIVSSDRFLNLIHDLTFIGGTVYLVIFFCWLSQQP